MKYPFTLIAGIIAVIAISLGALVAAGKADESLRNTIYLVIVVMVAPTVTQLLTILRSEKNAEQITQNTAITEQAKHDAEEVARNLAVATALLKEKEEEFLHQLKGTRNAVTLATAANLKAIDRSDAAIERGDAAIERGEKAYAEANGVNRKLAELRSDGAIIRAVEDVDHKVEDVDHKVAAVDEKVTEIKKRVEHEE